MRRLVLIGFACSYKTSVGKLIAKSLNVQHFDTDELVEQQCGMSAGELIDCSGQQALRDAEKQIVGTLPLNNCVVSCGGGVPLSDSAMRLLKRNSVIVWLRTSAPQVQLRLKNSTDYRPLHRTKDLASLTVFVAERDNIYKLYADVDVSTDGKTSQNVAEEVLLKTGSVLLR